MLKVCFYIKVKIAYAKKSNFKVKIILKVYLIIRRRLLMHNVHNKELNNDVIDLRKA